jgi:hypothetical protein
LSDLIFFALCAAAGTVPAFVALALRRVRVAIWATIAWFVFSVTVLWAIGLGPHGFILFAFLPFWFGNVVALIVALVRYSKERSPA